MITTEILTADTNTNGIEELFVQLSDTPFAADALLTALRADDTMILGLRDDERLIGTGTLVTFRLARSGMCGRIEDVVVDEAYRGQGLGKRLMEELIEHAREKGVRTLDLTSRPERVAANELYKALGFTHKETNVYVLKL